MVRRLVACLNGARQPGSHPALPLTPDELAAAALAALQVGATQLHVHPRDAAGAESLAPAQVAATVTAIRAAAPDGTVVSVTTRLLPGTDAAGRAELVSRWTVLPDLASVNMHEPGSPELAGILADLGVGVEAGLWTPDAARLFTAAGLAERCSHVLIEPMDPAADAALATGRAVQAVLDEAGVTLPRLMHGEESPAWAVFDAAAAAGLDVRMGLEDTLTGRSGGPVAGNAALIAEAVAAAGLSAGHSS